GHGPPTLRLVTTPRTPITRSRDPLRHADLGAGGGFPDLDAGGEHLFEFGEMGDDQDRLEVALDRADGFDQAVAALAVLGTEALVDDQRLEAGAGTPGKEGAERDPDGEVGAERLAAAVELVGPASGLVADHDVECLDRVVAPDRLLLGAELDAHGVAGHL